MRPDSLFSPADRDRIVAAIRDAEGKTSGEIRVKVISSCLGDTGKRARREFVREGIHKTAERNGVLILLVLRKRKVEVVADAGIHAKVPAGTWDRLVAGMVPRFREGAFTDGLVEAVTAVGALLRDHFPRRADDVNELPDSMSFGS